MKKDSGNTKTCVLETPLGDVQISGENDALTGLWFVDQKYFPDGAEQWIEEPNYPIFQEVKAWLKAYFAGDKPVVTMNLAPQGTPFQKAVWDLLLQIPYGQVTSYGTIAKAIAKRQGLTSMSAQAVGGAVGHNPISLIIPCHRVIGANGSLTGYAGGLDKKQALLKLEQVNVEIFCKIC